MARIRTLKPEILEDEKTACLSHEAYRLFIGMIVLADDHGGLRADSSWLAGQVFWGSPATGGVAGVEEALEEIAAAHLIALYEVRGQRYAAILGWNKHQRVDHPGKPRVPLPTDDGAWIFKPREADRVYFVQAERSRAIKIGVSWNPAKRLAGIQNGHHEPLRLLGHIAGTIQTERELHRRFAASRASGEWFNWTPELHEAIQELLTLDKSRENPREDSRGPSLQAPKILATDHDHDHEGDKDVPPPRDTADRIPPEAWRAADLLRSLLLSQQPKNKIAKAKWGDDVRTGTRMDWADTVRLIASADGRSYAEIEASIRWLFGEQRKSEYAFVVQSPGALRDKWDRIAERRGRGQQQPIAYKQPANSEDRPPIAAWMFDDAEGK